MFVHVHVYVDIFLYMTHLGCQLITYLTVRRSAGVNWKYTKISYPPIKKANTRAAWILIALLLTLRCDERDDTKPC